MRRREFIVVLGGAAAWPLATRAQQAERVRRIGVLMAAPADDPEYQARIVALVQRLQQLGWADGSNVRIDTRWAPDPNDLRRHAAELAALAPDVIVAATGTTTIAPLLQATRIVPIVFVLAIDPVGAGPHSARRTTHLSLPAVSLYGFPTIGTNVSPNIEIDAMRRPNSIADRSRGLREQAQR